MSTYRRRGIHDGASESPERSVLNRSENKSPQRVRSVPDEIKPVENNNAVESESESEEDEECMDRMTPAVAANSSQQQIDNATESTCAADPPAPPPSSPKAAAENKESKIRLKPILKYVFLAILFILPVLVASTMYMNPPELKSCRFEKLRQRPPLQTAEVWKALSVNIGLLLNKQTKSPNIYLLLHSSENKDGKVQKLIQDIALETSKCFDGQRPIEMSLQDFETQNGDDYGYPIEQYKNKLKEGNVFLIVNLNEIPPNAARALHTICETFSPIDPDVVIFLTLSTQLPSAGLSPTALADQTLRQLWKEMPDNELNPLITRVTDQVLLLQG